MLKFLRFQHFQILVVTVVAFLFFYSSANYSLKKKYKGNYTSFIHVGEKWVDNPILELYPHIKNTLVVREKGNDGQFFYYIAFDPFLSLFKDDPARYRTVVDFPPYRYSRIGYPLLIKAFSWNTPERFPQTMVYLVVGSFAPLVFLLSLIAIHYQRSPFWALTCLLVPGFLVSIRLSLPEPLAALFLMAGFFFYLKDQRWISAIFMSAAILVRETSLIFIIVMIILDLKQRKIPAAILTASSIIPYGLWRLFITWKLFPTYGWSTLTSSSHVLAVPYAGAWEAYKAIQLGQYPKDLVLSALVMPILLTALLILSGYLLLKRRNLPAVALIVYALLAISLNFDRNWRTMPNVERHVYEAFLILPIAFISLPASKKEYVFLFSFLLLALCYQLFFSSIPECFLAGFGFAL